MNIKNGIICFTFDDRNFEGWINALPLFKKYNAHATFLISEDIDDEAIAVIKKLLKAGHSVGVHTVNHLDAPEYFEEHGAKSYYENEILPQLKILEQNGIKVTSLAYPNNKRTDETDEYLSKYFKRFRAGNTNTDEKCIPVGLLDERRVMGGYGIGELYNTTEEDMLDKVKYVARENMCMTFFSHNIIENATFINCDINLLEKCLSLAEQEGVKVFGFDELP